MFAEGGWALISALKCFIQTRGRIIDHHNRHGLALFTHVPTKQKNIIDSVYRVDHDGSRSRRVEKLVNLVANKLIATEAEAYTQNS